MRSGLNILGGDVATGGLDILVGDRWLAAESSLRYRSHGVVHRESVPALEVVSQCGHWDIAAHYALHGDGTIVRRAEFVYNGPQPTERTLVRVPRFWLRGLCIGKPSETTYTMLAQYPPETRRLSEPPREGRRSPRMSAATARAVLLRNAKLELNVAVAFYSDTEYAKLSVEEHPGCIDVSHELFAQDELRPGLRLSAGSQLVRIVRGSEEEALQAFQGFYKTLGVGKPAHSPADAAKAIIYSAHPGGTIDSGFRDCGGFRNFTKLIPHIHSLGCNTLWLLPFWYGRVYAPHDYYRLDPKMGTPGDLKALTDEAHRRGMRVLGDLIPHGPRDELGFHLEHPDWICRDENGEMIYWWGCLYCDYANPGWQQYMADHAAHWVKLCGLDGYRVDVAGGGPPNWRPYGSNRPSYSGLWGGLRLMDKARREVAKHNPNAIWLAESHGNHWYGSAEYAYDWAFSYICGDHAIRQPPGDWCRDALQYLEYQKCAFPEHAYPLRFLTNHDQVRARMHYGVGLHRALLAMCAFTKGIPFLYHEQEAGDEWFVRRLYKIRSTYDELVTGTPYYLAVPAQPAGVMAFLRKLGDQCSVVAINFNNQSVTSRLHLPVRLMGLQSTRSLDVFEAFGDEPLSKLSDAEPWEPEDLTDVRVPLGPYEPAVIVLRPKGSGPAAKPKPHLLVHPKGTKPQVTRTGDRVQIGNGHYRVTIDGTKGGLIAQMGTPRGIGLLRGMTLREQRRKLLIGAAPIDFAKTRAVISVEEREHGRALVRATGELVGADSRPLLRYRHEYEADLEPQLRWTCTLEPLVDVGPAKTDLSWRLRFRPTSHWFANTAEGPLLGDSVFRHPSPHGFTSRYWHGSGEAVYQSSLYPLSPVAAVLGVYDQPSAIALEVQVPERPVLIVEDKEADSSRDIGGPASVAIAASPFGGNEAVRLRRGENVVFGVALAVRRDTRDGLWRHLVERQGSGRGQSLVTQGPNYLLRAGETVATVCRSAGGALRSMTWRGQPSLIVDSKFYTDFGLYGEWRDPLGRDHKMNASSSTDPEPDTTVRAAGSVPRVAFTSFFRHPYAGGRSLLSPRMQYHVAYEAHADGLRVKAGVRPMMLKPQASAFLAQTVFMADVDEWRVDEEPWQKLPPRGKTGRLWQSAEQGRLPRALAVRDVKSDRFVRFASFDAGSDVQNVFLHGGGNRATLFVAFLSGQPADVRPDWRRARYVIQTGGAE